MREVVIAGVIVAALAGCTPPPNAAVVAPIPGPAPGAVVAPVYIPPPQPAVEQPYTPPPSALAYSHRRHRHVHGCHYVNGHCLSRETVTVVHRHRHVHTNSGGLPKQ